MNLTFLTSADLHLGRASAAAQLADSSPGPEHSVTHSVASASYAWHQMVDVAIKKKVDAVLLAGDIIDRDNRYFEARTALLSGFNRLSDAGIPVILVAGNHDHTVLPELLRNNPVHGVTLLGEGGVWQEHVLRIRGAAVSFVGWSFPSPSVRYKPLQQFALQPESRHCIGLIHGDFGLDDSPYAPLASEDFQKSPARCWVLGHIHKPEILMQDPLCYYPGSPQALSAKETGSHGCNLLRVTETTVDVEPITISSVRYERIFVDVSGVEDLARAQAVIQQALQRTVHELDGVHLRELVADLIFTGTLSDITLPDSWEIESSLGEFSGILATIRKTENRCTASLGNLDELATEAGPAGILAQALLNLQSGQDSEFLQALRQKAVSQMDAVHAMGAYAPLAQAGLLHPRHELDSLLAAECERMLSALIQTRSEAG
ncbi:MAG: DNA repair exonuclease [Bacteroidetes bacterium HLUCCA01]|nr:MAG: DNA repair exonuclease [Bacteroidetes bacterium HLUCCA01]